MILLRSALFNVLFFSALTLLLLLTLPVMLAPRKVAVVVGHFISRALLAILRVVVGLRVEVRGSVHLLNGPAIIASKHQSAWETFALYLIARDPAYVMKRELMRVPLFGWISWKQGMIPVDRQAGGAALRHLLRAAEKAIADGRQIIIFPQGTRVAPGERAPYQPGIVALYAKLGQPVVPVALNSGRFWPRRSFRKYPGTITVEILEPIPPGLSKTAFLAELERRIEAATARLDAMASR
jgi:1-acyl-sn-glycerol-3-phosphate acyltransferase